ncbi:MAG: tetratricopeptide repeat protein [Oligoflexia bacterium]|nr:tetratricopeptide repeat protein [Oligoflexia bacterium]
MESAVRFIKIVTLVVTIPLLLSAVPVWADGDTASSADDQAGVSEHSSSVSLPLARIQDTWRNILEAMGQHDLKRVNQLVIELDSLKLIADVRGLDSYALSLIDVARRHFKVGQRSEAAFYIRKALQLSPDSPIVLAKAFPLVRETSSISVPSYLSRIMNGVWSHPKVWLQLLKGSIYPLLLAFTFGVMVAILLTFVIKVDSLIRMIGKPISSAYRGLIAPLLLTLLVLLPLTLGPLWTVCAWCLCLYIFLPQHRWLGFIGSAVLVAWGCLIPVRESLQTWLMNPGIQTMLDGSSGEFREGASERLEALAAQRSRDGALFFSLGQALRRSGRYADAEHAFLRAEVLLGSQAWTRAERAVNAYLSGNAQQADALFIEAEKLGLRNAAFYFNYSKVKLELLDTEKSREYLGRTVSMDPELARTLQQREELLGPDARLAVAETHLPFYHILNSALMPTQNLQTRLDEFSQILMPGASPPLMSLVGAALIGMFFFVQRRRSRVVPLSSYANTGFPQLVQRCMRIIPGGAWIAVNRPVIACALLSVSLFLLMPILHWPFESSGLMEIIPELAPYYVSFVSLLVLGTCYVGVHVEE